MDPIQALVQMRGQMQGPIGPNQGMGAPQLGAPPSAGPIGAPTATAHVPDPHAQTNGNQQDVLAEFGRQAVRGGDTAVLVAHLSELQRMFPKLAVARHENGRAELLGPAKDQFAAAAYGRAHGAKQAHVRNTGGGQRLHLEF